MSEEKSDKGKRTTSSDRNLWWLRSYAEDGVRDFKRYLEERGEEAEGRGGEVAGDDESSRGVLISFNFW